MPHTAPWQEPVRGGYPERGLFGLSGLELLGRLLDGTAPPPPISHLCGMALTEIGPGIATFTMPATRWLLGSNGTISVGALAMLADGPLGCAVHSALPRATGYVTSEMSLRQLRPAEPGQDLVARGTLVHAGSPVALSGVKIADERGELLVDASSLCFVTPLPDQAEDPPPSPPPHSAPPAATPDPFEREPCGAVVPRETWERMGGLAVLEALIAGELPPPPIGCLTGLRPLQAGAGEAVFALPCHEWLCSPLGTIEGGAIAMLADAAITAAIQTAAPAGAPVASVDVKVNFLRPVQPDGRELVARGHVRHGGRTIAVAEAELLNAEGRPVALATGSAMLLEPAPDEE
jgi:uncharacterized protein (TIGR00369 family)